MKVLVLKNKHTESFLPKKANNRDAGYDLVATSNPEIVGLEAFEEDGITYYHEIDYIQYRTGLFIAPEDILGIKDTVDNKNVLEKFAHTLGLPRSSVSKYHLQLCNSVATIDNPYRGEILLRFNYNWQPNDMIIYNGHIVGHVNKKKIYKKGEKIIQLMFLREFGDVEFELVDELPDSQRGEGRFGSSGK